MKEAGRRRLSLTLTAVILSFGVSTGVAYATSTQDKLNQAQKDKKQTESQLNETKDNLEDLKEEKNQLEGKLANLNQKLTIVSNSLNDLERKISKQEVEIQTTEEELAE